jgi:hypothetical protein
MMLLALTIAALLLTVAVRLVHAREVETTLESERQRRMSFLQEEGLTLQGDLLRFFELQGPYQGHDVEFVSRVFLRFPGTSDGSHYCYRARFRAPLQDMFVCQASWTDTMMGPIPAVPRTRTGDPKFDETYSVFIAPQTGLVEADFRTSPPAALLSWARPTVLDQLLQLQPAYLRVKDGECEVVGPPQFDHRTAQEQARAAGAIVALCTNIARAAKGAAAVEALPPESWGPVTQPPTSRWLLGAGGLLGALVYLALVSDAPSLRDANVRSPNEAGLPAWLHQPACVLAASIVVPGILVLISAATWWMKDPRGRTDPRNTSQAHRIEEP